MLIRRQPLRARCGAIKPWIIAFTSATIAARSATAQIWAPLSTADSRFAALTGGRRDSIIPIPGWSGNFLGASLYFVNNSALPYSLNDGALWAGRGANVSLTTGAMARYRGGHTMLDVVLAPTFVASQNRPFPIFRGADSTRSAFSSPWHSGAASIDLPSRFGDRGISEITFGESAVALTFDPVSVGVTSASEWWGPAIRNALVMSDNAAGIPRAFLRTARPLRTPIGYVTGELILGTLTESRFFDTLTTNDYRSLSGMIVTLRPAFDSTLSFGFTRVVYQPASGALPPIGRALDAIIHWEPLARPTDTLPNGRSRQEADQIFSLFGQWRIPAFGSEVYAEWARMEPPRSLREWLLAPQSTQAYTVGMQTAQPVGTPGHFVRAQLEFTNLEQTQAFADRPPPDYYTGRAAPQGYTQRGQPIGAGIGPGASSQWLAIDYLTPRWQGGAFVGRTRWENDALYRQRFANPTRHDVTTFIGRRGGWRATLAALDAQLTVGRRLDYLFPNDAFNPGEVPRSAYDVRNVTLEFQLTRGAARPVPLHLHR